MLGKQRSADANNKGCQSPDFFSYFCKRPDEPIRSPQLWPPQNA